MHSIIPDTYEYLVIGDKPLYTKKEIWDTYDYWTKLIKMNSQ